MRPCNRMGLMGSGGGEGTISSQHSYYHRLIWQENRNITSQWQAQFKYLNYMVKLEQNQDYCMHPHVVI